MYFIESIDSENPLNINQELFKAYLERVGCKYRHERDNIKERYTQLANELGLVGYFNQWLNPKLSQWDIQLEQSYEKGLAEIKERICKNEEAIKPELTKDTVSIATLHFIAQFYYEGSYRGDNHMGKDTQQALAEHLKHAVFNSSHSSHSTLLTLDSLVENSIGANRKIDIVYYVSVCKNNWDNSQWKKLKTQCSPEFLQYLYINYVQNSSGNNYRDLIYSESFLESVTYDFAQSTLMKFFKLLIKRHCNYIADIIDDSLSVEDIKNLVSLHDVFIREDSFYFENYKWTTKNRLINNMLHHFNFDVSENLLDSILSDPKVSIINMKIANSLKRFINFEISNDDLDVLRFFCREL